MEAVASSMALEDSSARSPAGGADDGSEIANILRMKTLELGETDPEQEPQPDQPHDPTLQSKKTVKYIEINKKVGSSKVETLYPSKFVQVFHELIWGLGPTQKEFFDMIDMSGLKHP